MTYKQRLAQATCDHETRQWLAAVRQVVMASLLVFHRAVKSDQSAELCHDTFGV